MKQREELKVGNTITDSTGDEYVISRVYDLGTFFDLEVIRKDNGAFGALRINKINDQPR